MWITIIWPSGRERRKWMGSLADLDRIIEVHQSWGMEVDIDSAENGMIRLLLTAPAFLHSAAASA